MKSKSQCIHFRLRYPSLRRVSSGINNAQEIDKSSDRNEVIWLRMRNAGKGSIAAERVSI